MNNILISIIIPVYNSSSYLQETLNSILKEELNQVEIICIDDGSVDNSLDILKSYENKNYIKVIHQNNQGASIARNNGLKIAVGDFIWFFDSDDLMIEGSINCIKENIKYNKYDLFITDFCSFENNIIHTKFKHSRKNLLFNKKDKLLFAYLRPPFPGNKIYKREIIINNDIEFAPVKIGQDLNFYLKYLCYASNIKYLKKETTKYRIVNGSISLSYDDRILSILDCFIDVEEYYNKHDIKDRDNILNIVFYANLIYQLQKLKNINDIKLKDTIFAIFQKEIYRLRGKIKKYSLYQSFKIYYFDVLYRKL